VPKAKTEAVAQTVQGSIRDRVAGADDIQIELFPVPEWDVELELRSMTAGERGICLAASTDQNTGRPIMDKLYARVLIASAYDPASGELAFKAEDEQMLSGKNGAVVERIASRAMQMSGFDDEAQDRLGNG